MAEANETQDGQNWFRRHVLEKLDDLGEGQKSLLDSQQRMHDSNQTQIAKLVEANNQHAAADADAFASIRQDIASFRLVKQIVYGATGMILAVVFGALVALATGRGT